MGLKRHNKLNVWSLAGSWIRGPSYKITFGEELEKSGKTDYIRLLSLLYNVSFLECDTVLWSYAEWHPHSAETYAEVFRVRCHEKSAIYFQTFKKKHVQAQILQKTNQSTEKVCLQYIQRQCFSFECSSSGSAQFFNENIVNQKNILLWVLTLSFGNNGFLKFK